MAIDTTSVNSNGADHTGEVARDQVQEWTEVVQQIHLRLLQDMDFTAVEKLGTSRAQEAVEGAARQLIGQLHPSLLGEDREFVVGRIIDEAVGFGPIEPLLRDQSISEVMVNA